MGLDMYLKSCNRTAHSVEELRRINNELSDIEPDTADDDVSKELLSTLQQFAPLQEPYTDFFSIFTEEGYWRKFNALHGWFVDNVHGGEDDCGLYEVHKEHLYALSAVLLDVSATKDASKLPPIDGFFFGSTDVDDYFDDVDTTLALIGNLIISFDFENRRLFYRSSW